MGGMVWLMLLPWLSWVPAMCQVWSKVLKGAIMQSYNLPLGTTDWPGLKFRSVHVSHLSTTFSQSISSPHPVSPGHPSWSRSKAISS